jgi:prepilin-type N-terminal cleavage/methylation domain-containing protein
MRVHKRMEREGQPRSSAHSGFTLIELMVAMAAVVILLGAVFAVNFRVSGLWVAQRTRSDIQQNFRFGLDVITQQVRQATAVSLPSDNTFGEALEFTWRDPLDNKVYVVRYAMEPDPAKSDSSRIMRTSVQEGTGVTSTTPVTEGISGLAALHFVRSGNRVVIIAVARYKGLGAEQTITYTTQTFTRVSGPY